MSDRHGEPFCLETWVEARVVEYLDAIESKSVDPITFVQGAVGQIEHEHRSRAEIALRRRLVHLQRAETALRSSEARWPTVPGFEITGELGRGGYGRVYRARDLELDREVALKIPVTGAGFDVRDLERLRREAAVISQLRHPGIIALHQLIELDESVVLVMELVEGVSLHDSIGSPTQTRDESTPSLAQRLCRDELGAPEAACEVLAQVLEALDHAHAHGIVHRDLKPSNIMLDRAGRVRVLDFGLARTSDQAALTRSGLVGTPQFLAPELLTDPHRIGPWTDVYAAGIIGYQLLTRHYPFGTGSIDEVLKRMRTGCSVPIRQRSREIPRDLAAVIECAMSPEPARRYPDAGGYLADLQRARQGLPTLARPVGWVGRTVRHARRRPDLAAAVALTVIMALVLIGWGLWSYRDASVRDAQRRVTLAEVHDDVQRWIDERRWPEAAAALQRVTPSVRDEERLFHESLVRDVSCGEQLEGILLARMDSTEYERRVRGAFTLLGFDLGDGPDNSPDIAKLAAAIASHRLETLLISVLDEWARFLKGHKNRVWLHERVLQIASAADPVPQHEKIRNARIADDIETLQQIADSSTPLTLPPRVLLMLADGLSRGHDRNRARRAYQQLTILHPQDAPGHFWFGCYLVLTNDQSDVVPAVQSFGSLLSLRPELNDIRAMLADTLLNLGDLELAGALLVRCLDEDPGSANTWISLAQSRFHGGDPRGALEASQKALECATDDRHRQLAHINLAVAHGVLGNLEAEEQEYRNAHRIRPTLGSATLLAGYYRRTSQIDQALSILDEALSLDPNSLEILHEKAVVLREQGKLDESFALYERVLAGPRGYLGYERDVLEQAGMVALRLAAIPDADTENGERYRTMACHWFGRMLLGHWRELAVSRVPTTFSLAQLEEWWSSSELTAIRDQSSTFSSEEAKAWGELRRLYDAVCQECKAPR